MFSAVLPFLLSILAIFRPTSRFLIYPSGIHMAYTEHPYELSFRWTSSFPLWDCAILVRQSFCSGTPDDPEWLEVSAEWVWSYDMASRIWEVVYTAILQDIYPECAYEYFIGAGVVWTPIHTFKVKTPYSPSSPSEMDLFSPASFLVVGDLGVGAGGEATRSSLFRFQAAGNWDALIHLGDIAYNLEDLKPYTDRVYFQEIEPLASILPYMVIPGNHEVRHNYTKYKADFRMPDNPASQGSSLYYSFNLGRAHIVAISSDHFYEWPEEERLTHWNWLVEDLESANRHREIAPWLIVLMHRPLYCGVDYTLPLDYEDNANRDCSSRSEPIKAYLEELFYTSGVDVVFEAHVHNYQRLMPIYHNLTVPSAYDDLHTHRAAQAPLYILEGSAGNPEGNDLLTPTPQSWMSYQNRHYGFGTMTIINTTHFYWEHYDSESNELLDYVWIIKDSDRYIVQGQ